MSEIEARRANATRVEVLRPLKHEPAKAIREAWTVESTLRFAASRRSARNATGPSRSGRSSIQPSQQRLGIGWNAFDGAAGGGGSFKILQ
jgi:hypothetical protein